MLKWLAAILLLSAVVPDPGKKYHGSNLAHHKGDDQSAQAPLFINQVSQSTPNEKASNDQPPHWYTSPEWWLCILGVPTLVFIGAQAKETRKAAEAARDSIRFQRAALAQWIDVEFERADCGSPLDPLGNAVGYAGVVLHFKALNNTPYPLTIKKVTAKIRPPLEWEPFVIEETERLPPARDGKAAIYRFHIRLSFEGPTLQNYVSGYLVIAVKGMVVYEPVTRERLDDQQFEMLIKCSPEGGEKIPEGRPREAEPNQKKSK
ncbi:MAG: hypothetical protein WA891_21440 [Acidobacteriaceae bacterium]